MALSAGTVTVAATATLLNAAQHDFQAGESFAVKVPVGGATVFIGGSTVTASGATQGWPLAAGESLFLDIDTPVASGIGEPIYAIVAAGTQVVNTLARGV